MKNFEKEIEALKKIERTPEELAELSRIYEELEEIDPQEEALRNERHELNMQVARRWSKALEIRAGERLKEIRAELDHLNIRKTQLTYWKGHLFRHFQDMKRADAEQRLSEVNEELQSIAYETQVARENIDKAAFDQLQERKAQAEEEKAEIMATIAATGTAVSEMTAAAGILRERIRKQTAAEAVKLFDQLAELAEVRRQEYAEIAAIEDAYNNTATDWYMVALSDPSIGLRRSLERNHNLIEELRKKAAE